MSHSASAQTRDLVVVVGASGEEQFQQEFVKWAQNWRDAGEQAGFKVHRVGGLTAGPGDGQGLADSPSVEGAADNEKGAKHDRQQLESILMSLKSSAAPTPTANVAKTESELPGPDNRDELWLVLIGHGTFDGKQAKFNLVGPDLDGATLADWLKSMERPLVVINCSSASSPFINALSGPQRIVLTATRNGNELNFSRFGGFLAAALSSDASDLDRDGQISLWEMFVSAADQTENFYSEQSRLATEHALLDDNGDALGTPADFFRPGNRTRLSGGEPDGQRARRVFLKRSETEAALTAIQRQQRDQLETELEQLKSRKSEMNEDAYFLSLEQLMLKLGEIYRQPQTKNDR